MKLGGREFKTKAAITKECRRILKATKVNTRIEGTDEAFVRDLLKQHYKLGATAAVNRSLYVVICKRSVRSKCFAFWSSSKGAPIDFSFKDCISAPSAIALFTQAAREAVANEVFTFKCDYWQGRTSATCPVSGKPMQRSTSHVDHSTLCFAALVDQFILAYQVDIRNVKYRGSGWADVGLVAAFAQYHKQHATLVVISAKSNLSKGSSGYRRVKLNTCN